MEIDARYPIGYSPIAITAALSNPQSIDFLLSCLDLKTRAESSHTIKAAAECLDLFAKHNFKPKSEDLKAACILAAHPEILLKLISSLDKLTTTPQELSLSWAMLSKNFSVITALANLGAEYDAPMKDACYSIDGMKIILPKLITPLQAICLLGNDSNIKIVDYLISNKADCERLFAGNPDIKIIQEEDPWYAGSSTAMQKLLLDPTEMNIPHEITAKMLAFRSNSKLIQRRMDYNKPRTYEDLDERNKEASKLFVYQLECFISKYDAECTKEIGKNQYFSKAAKFGVATGQRAYIIIRGPAYSIVNPQPGKIGLKRDREFYVTVDDEFGDFIDALQFPSFNPAEISRDQFFTKLNDAFHLGLNTERLKWLKLGEFSINEKSRDSSRKNILYLCDISEAQTEVTRNAWYENNRWLCRHAYPSKEHGFDIELQDLSDTSKELVSKLIDFNCTHIEDIDTKKLMDTIETSYTKEVYSRMLDILLRKVKTQDLEELKLFFEKNALDPDRLILTKMTHYYFFSHYPVFQAAIDRKDDAILHYLFNQLSVEAKQRLREYPKEVIRVVQSKSLVPQFETVKTAPSLAIAQQPTTSAKPDR